MQKQSRLFFDINGERREENYKDFLTTERRIQFKEMLRDIAAYGDYSTDFFPSISDMFRFMDVPVKDIKCVFLGMEPYPSWTTAENGTIIPEATGRSFEVRSVTDWSQKFKQSSMRNILKSLYYLHTNSKDDLNVVRNKIVSGEFPISQPPKWFDEMEKQGVVFLNAALTVQRGHPNTHQHIWEPFMTDLIEYINETNPDIKWILAGNQAQERAAHLVNHSVKVHHPRLDSFVTECPFKFVEEIHWIE